MTISTGNELPHSPVPFASGHDPLGFADEMQAAWDLAADLHHGQKVPGTDLPYLKHLAMVTFEIFTAHAVEPIADLRLAVICAILHDSIEDQGADADFIAARFGEEAATGIAALSKNPALPKADAMRDSLDRISAQPTAVWCVKLADRISNLHGVPSHWGSKKIESYRAEAHLILETLGSAHSGLARRLSMQIERYPERPAVRPPGRS
jgi:(p)ppGpp synthase/HD superfamily hydrolase